MRHRFLTIIISITGISGCTKFTQVPPPTTEITSSTVYSNNTSAAAVMSGVYSNMMSNANGMTGGSQSIGYYTGLQADELKNFDPTNVFNALFYTNSLNSNSEIFWPEIYNEIHVSNAVIEGLSNSSGVSDEMRQQLTGEAKFMRAFLHFYAVNFYGDVPLVTTTEFLTNNSISRSPVVQVYQQIIQDLKDAQNSLPSDFVDASGLVTTERTRPNKGAASALLARAYLYTAMWDSAETQATSVINSTNYGLDSNLNDVFLANSTEAIWQMQPVVPETNTWDAQSYVILGQAEVGLSQNLLSSFETGDRRLVNWVDSILLDTIYYYPYKYKVYLPGQPLSEYLMVLRLAEQYLIRAEARAQLGDVSGAQTDLNMIRFRAGLTATSASDKQSLLTAILHERQVELFTEWGHRWLDLKRTASVDSVMGTPGNVCAQKGGVWNPDWALFPIALYDLKINQHLTQNPGY